MSSFLQFVGDKWGKSSTRGWCVIPWDDPLVLYIYAAPQVIPPPAPRLWPSHSMWGWDRGCCWPHTSDLETEA